MKVKVPQGYSITYAGPMVLARAAFITDPYGIQFGHISGPDRGLTGSYTTLRHYVEGDKTSHRVEGWTDAQEALDHLIALHTMDPCQCDPCTEARKAPPLPHQVAAIYEFTTGDSGTGPFAVHYTGSSVLHILTAEGTPLGAVQVVDKDAEKAAREWGATHRGGLKVTGTRGPRMYRVYDRCIDCGNEPEDGQGVMAFESRLWDGSLPTDFIRCFSCNEKTSNEEKLK